jgi:plasmid stabilization system protein ParE
LSYRVRFTEEAKKDLDRLYDFLLGADLELAGDAVDAIDQAIGLLEKFPFSCRKAADGKYGPFLRELVVSFGSTGYVVLFEIEGRDAVTVVAVRHQRESDFY